MKSAQALSGLRVVGLGLAAAALLSACSPGSFSFGPGTGGGAQTMPTAAGKSFGRGPVHVALLLPLSGDPNLAGVGQSLANASELAIQFVETNPNIGENITVVLKDTGASTAGATQAAQQALGEGASLILGPLRADQVTAVGQVAKSAGVPVIGFSNNSGAASPGVYLLNVLPESEVKRSMGYAKKLGKKAFAGIFPTTDFGRIQEGAFRQAGADLGLNVRAVYNFSSEAEARNVVTQIVPMLQSGQIDTIFIPDRATAPSFANLLNEAGIAPGKVQFVGSADWDGDPSVLNTTTLAGAIFPAVDDAGYNALLPEYQSKFGSAPHKLATVAYTATILANAGSLANGTPRYDRAQLTLPAGFNGRDGVFRFLADGRSEYALVIKQVAIGSASVAEAAKL
ncbi:penicillin-binding protein activator [Devosia sp. ZB163]|uniref:penicillin-binding protein activator n=1 Tax=Devosia sp. ZB163 TaxID=3025938 RepID=UPI0023619B05|nr:penicillin-binding protein activator [Devosia sp. ZB163]MDC9822520.1 penicillin-binding protein activator [Devosia sp. ZB163]